MFFSELAGSYDLTDAVEVSGNAILDRIASKTLMATIVIMKIAMMAQDYCVMEMVLLFKIPKEIMSTL